MVRLCQQIEHDRNSGLMVLKLGEVDLSAETSVLDHARSLELVWVSFDFLLRFGSARVAALRPLHWTHLVS